MRLTPVIQFWMHFDHRADTVCQLVLDVESETDGGRHRLLEDY